MADDVGGCVAVGCDKAVLKIVWDLPSNSDRCWSDILVGWIVSFITGRGQEDHFERSRIAYKIPSATIPDTVP